MTELPAPLPDLLAAYRLPGHQATAERAASGLIQTTYIVSLGDDTRVVAQKTHPVFDPDGRGEALLGDIDAITAHLDACGLATPRLLRRADGSLGWRDLAHEPRHLVGLCLLLAVRYRSQDETGRFSLMRIEG